MLVDNGIGDGLFNWKTFHDISREFWQNSIDGNEKWWQWYCMMNVDEDVEYLKDYACMTCILEPWNPPTLWRHASYVTMSNFDAYRHKLKEFQHWPHSPLNVQCPWIMALEVGFLIGRHSMTFQESFDKDSIDGNGKWRQWDYMMNVDENMDDLKHYAGTTCMLEPWNPPTLWRYMSYLTMPNFDAYRHKSKEFQHWPLSLLNVRHWWIMALVMGFLEDVPWHFKRVLMKILLMGMSNDYNEIAWWTLMKCGLSQILCGNNMHSWALKPSHTMKACVLSNHVKFWRIQAQVEGISTLAPFTA